MKNLTSLHSKQLLRYAADHFETYSYLNGNNITYPHQAFPKCISMGVEDEYLVHSQGVFSWEKIDQFLEQHKHQYIFAHFNYQVKDFIETFSNGLNDPLDFPLVHLYVPRYMFLKEGNAWKPYDRHAETLLNDITQKYRTEEQYKHAKVSVPKARFSHSGYIQAVNSIKEELAKGNVYEINFCNTYKGAYDNINHVKLYEELNHISPMPFSVLYKHRQHVLLSASPERFIKKEQDCIISQPIKGTAARKSHEQEDLEQKQTLEKSLKERTENIMIVDLVRNDLSKICSGGSVRVEELCKVYTFEKVHQLVSTIKGDLEHPDLPFSEVLKALFPMGSMTGAPKVKAMQLIDELEAEGRGLFSGTFGYFDPQGNFDFNVIIRSLLFNEEKKEYRFHAGSAITMASNAEQEYQECDVKTLPIRLLLKQFPLL